MVVFLKKIKHGRLRLKFIFQRETPTPEMAKRTIWGPVK